MNTERRVPLMGGASLFALSLFLPGGALAHGLPGHGRFVEGEGGISKNGSRLIINQGTQTGIVNWKSFSVGRRNAVIFDNQHGATLNVVKGGDVSRIAGSLQSAGSVYLINRAGVLVTGSGVIDTQGNFAAGGRADAAIFGETRRLRPNTAARGSVINRGTIVAGGTVALSGRRISDAGAISARSASLKAGRGLYFAGQIDAARGVETSGAHVRLNGGMVHASTWLVDPVNLTVDSAAAGTIDSSLGGGTDVTLQTTSSGASGPGNQSAGPGDINIESALTWNTTASLTLDAYHGVNIAAPVSVAGSGALTIDASHGVFLTQSPGRITFANLTAALSINGHAYTLVKSLNALKSGIASAPAGFFALARNIDASATAFTGSPIPTAFGGMFNGLGNTISNLTIKSASGPDVGLFAHVKKAGNISNLELDHAVVRGGMGGQAVGALAGLSNGRLSNDQVFGGGFVLSTRAGSDAGGLVGDQIGGSIKNSTAAIKVTGVADAGGLAGSIDNASLSADSASGNVAAGSGGNAGGLAGIMNDSSIDQSSATGNAKANGAGAWVGGLVGEMDGTSSVANSFASGGASGSGNTAGYAGLIGYFGVGAHDTVSFSHASGLINGGGSGTGVGGLVGYIDVNGHNTVSDSYAQGDVSGGDSTQDGGLVGFVASGGNNVIRRTYATGDVTGGNSANVGGLVGWNVAAISNSYATGSATGSFYNGGLVGWNFSGGGTHGRITTSYSTGAASGGIFNGGLVGFDTAPSGSISNSYWDTSTSGISGAGDGAGNVTNDPGITGLNGATLQSGLPAGFSGAVWGSNNAINNGLPYLLSLASSYP